MKQVQKVSKVLLTFTGFHDPFSRGLVGDEEQPGPVLSLVAAMDFDIVILLATPATLEITSQTRAELEKRHPSVQVEVRNAPLADPTDYREVLEKCYREARDLCAIPAAPSSAMMWADSRDVFLRKTRNS